MSQPNGTLRDRFAPPTLIITIFNELDMQWDVVGYLYSWWGSPLTYHGVVTSMPLSGRAAESESVRRVEDPRAERPRKKRRKLTSITTESGIMVNGFSLFFPSCFHDFLKEVNRVLVIANWLDLSTPYGFYEKLRAQQWLLKLYFQVLYIPNEKIFIWSLLSTNQHLFFPPLFSFSSSLPSRQMSSPGPGIDNLLMRWRMLP